MTPQFKSAGISILRYVYETCQGLGVPAEDIPGLLLTLSFAVVEGQEGTPTVKSSKRQRRLYEFPRLPVETVNAMHDLKAQGMNNYNIAKTLGIAPKTVTKYLDTASIRVAEPASPVLPHSNGATDRRADDPAPL